MSQDPEGIQAVGAGLCEHVEELQSRGGKQDCQVHLRDDIDASRNQPKGKQIARMNHSIENNGIRRRFSGDFGSI